MGAPLPLRVVIIEDSEDDAELIARGLRRGGYTVYAPEHHRHGPRRLMLNGILHNGDRA